MWACGALLAAGVRGDAPAPADTGRPNFVFILTDDQRWNTLGVVQREQEDPGAALDSHEAVGRNKSGADARPPGRVKK